MTETADPTPDAQNDPAALRARAEELERQLRDALNTQQDRLIRAELKAEAVRAGMVDLDGLKLIDTAQLHLTEGGEVEGAAAVMSRLRSKKPWLFAPPSSSSPAVPPPSSPPQKKLATEMTEAEWRAARAELLRRR
jgi:hypothetical protein